MAVGMPFVYSQVIGENHSAGGSSVGTDEEVLEEEARQKADFPQTPVQPERRV